MNAIVKLSEKSRAKANGAKNIKEQMYWHDIYARTQSIICGPHIRDTKRWPGHMGIK